MTSIPKEDNSGFKISDIYDKSINFLIGSGASYGLLPTLALKMQDMFGDAETIETLATDSDFKEREDLIALLFMHYYQNCIKPASKLNIKKVTKNSIESDVFDNYENFIDTILKILEKRGANNRSCNLFTTNYDGCFELVSDKIIEKRGANFILNDGSRGFMKKYVHTQNFNSTVYKTGIFNQQKSEIPQINLVHLHGSIFWKRSGENILLDYNNQIDADLDSLLTSNELEKFSEIINDSNKNIKDLLDSDFSTSSQFYKIFLNSYNKLPIVNPTKWKFHETVFDEHYYQMLRFLSYELEKPNSILITFGFSFADEHIRNVIKRSLSNPSLQLYICCFDAAELKSMNTKFKGYNNIETISIDGLLDFSTFNKTIFTLNPSQSDSL